MRSIRRSSRPPEKDHATVVYDVDFVEIRTFDVPGVMGLPSNPSSRWFSITR